MMNDKSLTLTEREHERFLQTYKRLPLEADRAEGMYIWTHDGSRYLDFLGGIAVNALGHSHPKIIAAIEHQIRRYMHLSNYFYQDAQVEFVERLCAAGGYARAFLANSGTEVADGAMKFARSWGSQHGKTELIGFSGGFHGRTYGALSIMDKPKYKDGMGPFLAGTKVLPFNDSQALREAVGPETCAVFVEFLQGEGGVNWVTKEFVETIFALRAEHNFLVVADEVQAGGGRTGRFFSFEQFGVRPDIVTVAKGIGGGLPLGAILTTEELAEVWTSGQHGTTFGGNAVSCAAGSIVIDELANGLMEHVGEIGGYIEQRLKGLSEELPGAITEIRGAGTMWGIELSVPAGPIVEALMHRKIIANATSDTVVRLLPPFIVEREHVDMLIDALRECLTEANVPAQG